MVKKGVKTFHSRKFFDNGSNGVLVRNEFGEKNRLRGQQIRYRLETVGGNYRMVNGKL